MDTRLVFIKLGGSSITDKSVRNSVRYDVLRGLVAQIKAVSERRPDLRLIIGHGQGSFAHFPAKEYRIAEGLVHSNAAYGFAQMEHTVLELHQIVLHELLAVGLPAISYLPSQTVIARSHSAQGYFIDVLTAQLDRGLLPVITGDGVLDNEKGATIWSADYSLPFYAVKLADKGYKIDRIVHVTQTPGVYHDIQQPERGVIARITPDDFAELEKTIGGSAGVDVTGGMLEKVRQAVDLAKKGIGTSIVDDQADLAAVLEGNGGIGTTVGW